MKKPLHIILVFTIILTSCDKRKEAIERYNTPQEISFGSTDGTVQLNSKVVTDSLKLNQSNPSTQITKPNHGKRNIKSITIEYKNKNIASLSYKSSSKSARLFYQGRMMTDLLPVDANKLTLDFENDTEELTSLEFTITDKFNNTSKITYTIFSFSNLAPIASLSCRHSGLTSNYEYELDASKSFDEDRNQGGAIDWYIFHIDGHEIKTKSSKIEHVFNKPGTYPIDLWVIDNQGKASRTVSKSITIKPDGK